MSNEDEEDYAEQAVVQYVMPCWKFELWDMAGVMTTTVAGLFLTIGQGLNLAAREFSAMAQWRRQRFDQAEYQAAYEAQQRYLAEELERQVGLDEHWLSDETKPEDLR